MNRRSFIGLLGSLPFVGGLFSWGRESEKDRFERLAHTGLVKDETFDFRGYPDNTMLTMPHGGMVRGCTFYGNISPFYSFQSEGKLSLLYNCFTGEPR